MMNTFDFLFLKDAPHVTVAHERLYPIFLEEAERTDPAFLEEATSLGLNKELVEKFDCRRLSTTREFFREVKRRLAFPRYFGGNWHAMEGCLKVTAVQKGVLAGHSLGRFNLHADTAQTFGTDAPGPTSSGYQDSSESR